MRKIRTYFSFTIYSVNYSARIPFLLVLEFVQWKNINFVDDFKSYDLSMYTLYYFDWRILN